MTRLVSEGWVAPENPGCSRRLAVGAIVASLLLLVGWTLLVTLPDEPARGEVSRTIRIDDEGRAAGVGRSRDMPLASEVRTSGDTRYLVVRGRMPGSTRSVRALPPASVDRELVATRVVPPRAGEDTATVIVTIPTSQMPDLPKQESAGSLRELMGPIDSQISEAASDRRLHRRLHDGWWWIVPLGLLVSVVLPLWLWRRERRRCFSMRVPGPGTKLDSAPPSSLDPVGAAVLLAGARPLDAGAAFAGHVLDLVERRQLRLKRNTDPDAGRIGAQIGLAHADEEAVPDDAAVAALRRIVRDDDVTVDVPDDPRYVQALPDDAIDAWRRHVAARARFERMVSRYPSTRIAAACAACVAFSLAGLAGMVLGEYPGARRAGMLVIALMVPAAFVLGAWLLDARRWRVVSRDRRTERAQWVAWRRAIGTMDGPALDARNLPIVVATGPVDGLVRDSTTRDAVGLDAVTIRTVASLRAMCGDAP